MLINFPYTKNQTHLSLLFIHVYSIPKSQLLMARNSIYLIWVHPNWLLIISTVNPKNKTATYFMSKMVLFSNSREVQFGTCKLWQKPQANATNKGEDCYFMEKKEDVRRCCFQRKPAGEKQKCKMMMVSHWLGSTFLIGDAVCIFPC